MLVLGASYPFLDVLWDMLIFFSWLIFIWIAITVLIDVFRRHDISGWGKAAWTVFVVVLPWLGALIYLITNHQGMAERRDREALKAQTQFDDYVRTTAGTPSPAAEIERAKKLLDDGTISPKEFDLIKDRLLTAA